MNELAVYCLLFVSRRSDFAVQLPDGLYARVHRPLISAEIRKHLAGEQSIGGYLISEQGTCSYAVFDADTDDGLYVLRDLQRRLALAGITAYLEQSRRGGHLWVFFSIPASASSVRSWLMPFCPPGVEFYPKQGEGRGVGSLIRLPLGVHLRSGERYPFVTWTGETFAPVAGSLHSMLSWLTTIERSRVPDASLLATAQPVKGRSVATASNASAFSGLTIRDWCASQDPMTFIGRYVDLDRRGVGCCPFGWHHAGGVDHHASFKVYDPGVPGGYCWYCHVWEQGGSVFDFLRHYDNLDAHELWQRIKRGAHG
jgi:hypothetical protein